MFTVDIITSLHCCSRTQSLESSSGRHTCDWHY